MCPVSDAELHTAGIDEITLTFSTTGGEEVTSHVGDFEITTLGPVHFAAVNGLTPNTAYEIAVPGALSDERLPHEVRTLAKPPGKLLTTFATVNDTHLGEIECGRLENFPQMGPVFETEPGDEPFATMMNSAAVSEIEKIAPDAVIAKGDLTDSGKPDELDLFLETYGVFGDRLHYFRGNHDARDDPEFLIDRTPHSFELEGAVFALVDTVIPGSDRGQLSSDQTEWLDALAKETSKPVFVLGHHHPFNPENTPNPTYFGINFEDSLRLCEVIARRENIVAYLAGHTHRNRVRRFARARNIPIVEAACSKDYPGAWMEYRVHEGGFTQTMHRISDPRALAWSEKTRVMYAGFYAGFALGTLSDRCFTELF